MGRAFKHQGSGVFFRMGKEVVEITEENYRGLSNLARETEQDLRSCWNEVGACVKEKIDANPALLKKLVRYAERYQRSENRYRQQQRKA